jgi:transposase-like protein
MIVNGTGIRATGRILGISKDTVTALLKKLKNGYGMLIMIILKTVKI